MPYFRFRGRFHCKVEGKGRISLPAAFRSFLETSSEIHQFVLQKGLYENKPYVKVHPVALWEKEEDRQKQVLTEEKWQEYCRFYLSSLHRVSMDESFRFLIPLALRKAINLDKNVVLIGMGEHFEIWSEPAWEKLLEKQKIS